LNLHTGRETCEKKGRGREKSELETLYDLIYGGSTGLKKNNRMFFLSTRKIIEGRPEYNKNRQKRGV